MEKEVILAKVRPYLPAAALLALCAVMPEAYFGASEPWHGALLYHFTHANIWHFAGNGLILAKFRPRWASIPPAYLSASAAAIMPFTGFLEPTCGLSGMIFAFLARRDALLGIRPWRLMALNLLLAIVPHYNWKIHLVSYAISYVAWRLIMKYRK